MEYRIEHDTLGEVKVPADKLWAAQTQRSKDNFKIGWEKPTPFASSFLRASWLDLADFIAPMGTGGIPVMRI